MAHLPPLLPTPPASLKLRDTDAVESRAPKRHRPLEPRASDSRRREPYSPPSSRPRTGELPPPPSSKARRRTGELPPPPLSKVRRQSRSPLPSKVRRRSRSPSPSKFRRRSRSPWLSKVRRRSRSPPSSKLRRRSRSLSLSEVRRRSRSPPPSKVCRQSRSPPPSRSRSPLSFKVQSRSRSPPSSKVWHRSRSPPSSKVRHRSRSPSYVSGTQDLQRAKPLSEGERSRPSSPDESLLENRLSCSHCSCKQPETSSAALENSHDPAIRGHEQKLDSEKMDGKNQSDDKAASRSARRKKMKSLIWAEAKKEFMEMKKDKLLENIKKLHWLLEKDGADMAEIMEFRSLLESTKKQYVENEAQLTKEGSSAPLKVLNRDRLEETHVETMAAPVEKVDRDEQSMDSGKVEGISLKVCEAVSDDNELVEEVNRLKDELETVRQDRDYQLGQAQFFMADVAKQKEVARRYGVELEDAMMRVSALEKGCLLRSEMINALQIQLASANEKLTVPSPRKD